MRGENYSPKIIGKNVENGGKLGLSIFLELTTPQEVHY